MSIALRIGTRGTEAAVVGTALVVGVVGLAAVIAGPSMILIGLVFGGIAFGTLIILTRQVRRPLLALLVFIAPIEINKAVLVSLVSRYDPVGPHFSPGLYLSLAHVALLALGIAWLGRRALLERRWPPMTALDALALAYAAFVWLRSIGAEQGALSIASAAAYSLAVLAFYIASHTLRDASDVRLVVRAAVAALLLTTVYAAAQFALKSQIQLPGIKALAAGAQIDLGDGIAFRPPGFLSHPNSLAHYLVIVLSPAIACVLMGPRRLPARAWRVALAVALAAGGTLLATLSRGGWVSAAVAAAFIVAVYFRAGLISSRQMAWGFGVLVLCGMAAVVVYPNILLRLTEPDGRSVQSRVLLADMANEMIKQHPWIGVGFGDYHAAAYGYHPASFAFVSADYQLSLQQLVVHNHYLLLAAELGIPATLFFVYLLWRFARLAWPLERWRSAPMFALAVGLCAAIVGQGVFFNSDNYYADTRVFLFWLCAGILQALSLQRDRGRRP